MVGELHSVPRWLYTSIALTALDIVNVGPWRTYICMLSGGTDFAGVGFSIISQGLCGRR